MAKIALVDDDRNILISVSIALEAEGFEVETYNDGASALFGLQDNPPDLAVFDVKMPRMDGMELLRRLRQNSTLPVIFLTSKDDEVDEVLGQRFRIGRIGIQEPSPAATDADNFVAFVGDASDHRLDGGVESWDVSAAGEDSDAHR